MFSRLRLPTLEPCVPRKGQLHAVGCVVSESPCGVMQVGLDAAGKTTILYKLKLGEIVTTIPTIGEGCGLRASLAMLSLSAAGCLVTDCYIQPALSLFPKQSCQHAHSLLQALTWRPWSTRTSVSRCGMWEARTRSARCGATTSRTHRFV